MKEKLLERKTVGWLLLRNFITAVVVSKETNAETTEHNAQNYAQS